MGDGFGGGGNLFLDNLRILPTANRVAPFIDAIATASSGSASYTSVDPGYGVTPYEGLTQLRMTGISSYTMTIRELQLGDNCRVSYFAANRSASAPNDSQVSVDGTVYIGGPGYTVAGTAAWTNQTFYFTATGTTAALKFEGLNAGDRTVFFDGFSLPVSTGSLFLVH